MTDHEPVAVRLTRVLELVEAARRSVLLSEASAHRLIRRAEKLIREVRDDIDDIGDSRG